MPVNLAFLSGAPGPGELIVIFLAILVLFGPKRLPEIARMVGKTLNDLRRASQDFKDQIMTIDEVPIAEPDPAENDTFSEEEDFTSDDHQEDPQPLADEAVEDGTPSGQPGEPGEAGDDPGRDRGVDG